jgi:PAS domain S-box-containing protein
VRRESPLGESGSHSQCVRRTCIAAPSAPDVLVNRKAQRPPVRRRFAHLLGRTIPQLIWTARPPGSMDYCNRRFADYAGLPALVLAARGWEQLVYPADRDETLAAWRAAVEAGTAFRAETRLRRADGNHRWHLVLADPQRGKNGAITGWFGSCTDIQDQKDAERVLSASGGSHAGIVLIAGSA